MGKKKKKKKQQQKNKPRALKGKDECIKCGTMTSTFICGVCPSCWNGESNNDL